MLYAILCYNSEEIVCSWTKAQDDAVMERLAAVHGRLEREGRLGPTVRLMPTTAATTIRKSDESIVLDGPFVETKEQLLGFYLVDCKDLDEAVGVARELLAANEGTGGYEIRPLKVLIPGSLPR